MFRKKKIAPTDRQLTEWGIILYYMVRRLLFSDNYFNSKDWETPSGASEQLSKEDKMDLIIKENSQIVWKTKKRLDAMGQIEKRGMVLTLISMTADDTSNTWERITREEFEAFNQGLQTRVDLRDIVAIRQVTNLPEEVVLNILHHYLELLEKYPETKDKD